jgi:hypothetical protein
MKNFEVRLVGYSDLTDEEQESQPNNGCGKEEANYIKVFYNDKVYFIESDAMEPEDASFCRDLGWVAQALEDTYYLGLKDGKGE